MHKSLDLKNRKGARASVIPERLAPMLASLPEGEYSRPGMIYEPKLDGMRALAFVNKGQCRLVSRRFIDITDQYPSLAAELSGLTTGDALLDGEIIALNEIFFPVQTDIAGHFGVICFREIFHAVCRQGVIAITQLRITDSFHFLFIDPFNTVCFNGH